METEYSVTYWIVSHIIAVIVGAGIGIFLHWLKYRKKGVKIERR